MLDRPNFRIGASRYEDHSVGDSIRFVFSYHAISPFDRPRMITCRDGLRTIVPGPTIREEVSFGTRYGR